MNSASHEETKVCLNCHHALDQNENYCSNCGQKAIPDLLTFRYFFNEFLSSVFSIDSKLIRTIRQLFLRPAFLTNEFISGRRIRYINPIQLFLISSFLYFLINSITFFKEQSDRQEYFTVSEGKEKIAIDSIDIQKKDSVYILGSGINADTLSNSYIGKFLQKGQEFNNMDRELQEEKIANNVSIAVFLLLPIFAMYLGWFFREKRKHYLENVVFSLHFHAFYYLLGTFFQFLDRLLPSDLDTFILNLLVAVYLIVAIKKFYAFSWLNTVIRFLGLLILYTLTVSAFLIASIVLTILL